MNKYRRNIRDAHTFYLEKGAAKRKSGIRDPKEFCNIVETFTKYLVDKVFSGYDVELSRGMSLGVLGVRGRKVTPTLDEDGNIVGLAPDWKTTKELWESNPEAKKNKQIVYFMNEHSSGVRYTINWFKRGMTTENSGLYNLALTKGPLGIRRKLSKKIKNEKTEFIVVTKTI